MSNSKNLKEKVEKLTYENLIWAGRGRAIKASNEVDSPLHYTVGGFEALEVIKAKLTPEEYRGYCKGNILKYIMRANYKGTHDTDCGKVRYYATELEDAL